MACPLSPTASRNSSPIPQAAVWETPGGTYVTVVGAEEPSQRAIKTGLGDGTYVEVVEGLEEGEVVQVQYRGPMPGDVYKGGKY